MNPAPESDAAPAPRTAPGTAAPAQAVGAAAPARFASAAQGHTMAQVQHGLAVWEQLSWRANPLLRPEKPDAAWVQHVGAFARTARQAVHQDADLALFALLRANASDAVGHYSEQHALACLCVCELAAQWLEWSEAEHQALVLAALTMNLSITAVQDSLAEHRGQLSAPLRERMHGHALASARLLEDAGVTDAMWLYAVRHHHEPAGGDDAASAAPPAPRLAELLRRVDVYTAKLSRRGSRDAVTPALAARDACLGPDGHPDSVGATLLRVTGVYPPGTYVELANGEIAVVVRRGEMAHTPLVASLRRADWSLISPPLRRDSAGPDFAVRHGVEPSHVRVLLDPAPLLVEGG